MNVYVYYGRKSDAECGGDSACEWIALLAAGDCPKAASGDNSAEAFDQTFGILRKKILFSFSLFYNRRN